MDARLVDTAPHGVTATDRLTTSWPFAALVHSLRRAVAGVVASGDAWYAGRREYGSRLRVSERWLAEHERECSKHEERI